MLHEEKYPHHSINAVFLSWGDGKCKQSGDESSPTSVGVKDIYAHIINIQASTPKMT